MGAHPGKVALHMRVAEGYFAAKAGPEAEPVAADAVARLAVQHLAAGLVLKLVILTDPALAGGTLCAAGNVQSLVHACALDGLPMLSSWL